MKTIFKYLMIIVVAVVLGIGSGYVFQRIKSSQIQEKFYWGQWDSDESTKIVPIAFVHGSDSHNFGKVSKGQTPSHDFVIENQGIAELEISLAEPLTGAITCDLGSEKTTLRTNNTFPVTVTVDGDKLSGKQTATFVITTNDENKQVTLTVTATSDE